MKAVLINSGLQYGEINLKAKDNDSILEVRRAGICGTDVAISRGDYKVKEPLILGHEIFGILKRSPSYEKIRKEERVVTEINVYCNNCYFCKKGMVTHCRNIETLGISRDGGFAEMLAVPYINLHKVPDEIRDEEATFIEPLAAAIQLTKMSPVKEGESVLIIGSGRMGLLILQVLKTKKPSLIAVLGRSGKKLSLAKSFGADHVYTPSQIDQLTDLVDGNGFDHVVEATGNTDGLKLAIDLVKPRGTVHVKSTHGLPAQLDITKAVVKEVRIQGSRCGPFEEAIKMLKEREVVVKEMVSSTYRLHEYKEAFEKASSGDAIKVQFVI